MEKVLPQYEAALPKIGKMQNAILQSEHKTNVQIASMLSEKGDQPYCTCTTMGWQWCALAIIVTTQIIYSLCICQGLHELKYLPSGLGILLQWT